MVWDEKQKVAAEWIVWKNKLKHIFLPVFESKKHNRHMEPVLLDREIEKCLKVWEYVTRFVQKSVKCIRKSPSNAKKSNCIENYKKKIKILIRIQRVYLMCSASTEYCSHLLCVVCQWQVGIIVCMCQHYIHLFAPVRESSH